MSAPEPTLFHISLTRVIDELNAPKNQRNSFGNYNYRSAEDIIEAVKPLLTREGLRMKISDEIQQVGARYYIRATVTVSGHGESDHAWAMAREPKDKKGMDASQITGATSSYARKYALNGMFCIDDTKDADSYAQSAPKASTSAPATEKQLALIKQLAAKQGMPEEAIAKRLEQIKTAAGASAAIERLQGK